MLQGLTRIIKVLPANTEAITFTNNIIVNDSIIEVYTDKNIPPLDVTMSGHSVTIKFEKQASPTEVAITVNNEDIVIPEELGELNNVEVSTANDGDVLTYDADMDLWLPAEGGGSGGSTVIVSPTYSGGTNIATINVDGEDYDINAPTPDNISLYSAPISDPKTQIASFVKNGVTTPIYAPTGGSGGASSLNDLSDVSASNPRNGDTLVYNTNTSKYETKRYELLNLDLTHNIRQINEGDVLVGTAAHDMDKKSIYSLIYLNNVKDVTAYNPNNDDVLYYNAGFWINGPSPLTSRVEALENLLNIQTTPHKIGKFLNNNIYVVSIPLSRTTITTTTTTLSEYDFINNEKAQQFLYTVIVRTNDDKATGIQVYMYKDLDNNVIKYTPDKASSTVASYSMIVVYTKKDGD